MVTMLFWLQLARDATPAIQTVTATSIMGWGAFVFGFVACVVLIWDRVIGKGKSLAKIDSKLDGLCVDVKEIETTAKVMDVHLKSLDQNSRQLTYEVKGAEGQNGIKGVLREHTAQIAAIVERNRKADILAAIFERELKFDGPERRRAARQAKELLGDEGGGT